MMRFVREFRLVPVVLFATICLFTLKTIGLLLDGGYTLGGVSASKAENTVAAAPAQEAAKKLSLAAGGKQSWAQEMFGYPDITGSVSESKPADKPAPTGRRPGAPDAVNPAPKRDGAVINTDAGQPASPAERAILERLQERRQEIEARARELEIRDGLLKAAEKRLEARLNELKEMESRVSAAIQKKEEADAGRFKGLISMYESMKAKDAAKIFDRLDIAILVEVTNQMNPRRMSDILGQMSPETAERLTAELASRALAVEKISAPADLPKIQGKPSGG